MSSFSTNCETQPSTGTVGMPSLDTAAAEREHIHGLGILAQRHREQGRYAAAEELLQRALEIAGRAYAPDDLEIAGILNDLGVVHKFQGRYEEAERCYRR